MFFLGPMIRIPFFAIPYSNDFNKLGSGADTALVLAYIVMMAGATCCLYAGAHELKRAERGSQAYKRS